MAPNGSYCSWNKHCFLTSKKRDSNNKKKTSFCPDTSTMSRSLLNKGHSLHGSQLTGNFTRKPCESILNWSLHGAQLVGFRKTYRLQNQSMYLTVSQKHGELWFFLQVNNSNIFLKRDVSKKSNIDTTIDFVNTPNIQELTLSWTFLFQKKSGIGES